MTAAEQAIIIFIHDIHVCTVVESINQDCNGDFVHPHIRSGGFEELSNLLFPSPSPDLSDLLLALLHCTIHLLV